MESSGLRGEEESPRGCCAWWLNVPAAGTFSWSLKPVLLRDGVKGKDWQKNGQK